MRADVTMQTATSRQSDQLGQEEHQAAGRSCTGCPDSGIPDVTAAKTEGQSKGQEVTDVAQKCNQEEGKTLQRTTHSQGKVQDCSVSLPAVNIERLRTAKMLVDKVVKKRQIFSIQGPYPVIRSALRARGWVEQRRCPPKQHGDRRVVGRASSNDVSDTDDDDNNFGKKQDTDELYDLMSCLVRKEMVYFYWLNRRDAINTNNLQKEQIINHFGKASSFTTKVGLCVNLRNLHWFDSVDPDTFFPRCYKLQAQDERHAFIEDYRRTACASLLKYIVEREGTGHNSQDSALKVCQKFLESLEHQDIDMSLEPPQTLTTEEWAEFIDSYYLVVHDRAEVENSDHLVPSCKAMLQRLGEVSPQLDVDGMHNIWIIKPGAQSRGRGIKCVKRLDQILRLVDGESQLIRDSKWVVQKYLEHPLLVHGTKFDVRQWFLVTSWSPLTVWFYKKCYLRFSTQPFSLDILDKSVHLCNNSIQKHLRHSKLRHKCIPADNMWSDDQFRSFLSSCGWEDQWQAVIVPGMKRAVIHALKATQDLIESRKNSFELYGADFILGHDLHPWLIEINASPTMAPSTPVTAQLCAAVQKDTLRVVLDWRADHTANTGDFQLIYRQAAVEVSFKGTHLLVKGLKIKPPYPLPPLESSRCSAPEHKGPVKKKEPAAESDAPSSSSSSSSSPSSSSSSST